MITREEKNKDKAEVILKEERKKKRTKLVVFLLKILLIISIIIAIIYCSCRYIGNMGLNVKEYSLTYETLPTNFDGAKIVHFSDIHYNTTFTYDDLVKLKDKINYLKPDIVIFSGDLFDDSYTPNDEDLTKITNIFKEIDATIGKYSVLGEQDNDNSVKVYINSDFIMLDDRYELLYNKDYTPILLVGYTNNIENSFSYFDNEKAIKDIFTIVVTHKPDNADLINEVGKDNVKLILAGHSHNGQIYLGKGLLKVDGANKYNDNYYKINNSDLYISSGLGTSKYKFRLFNHPSINLYRLNSN